jgi:hypothetical protein
MVTASSGTLERMPCQKLKSQDRMFLITSLSFPRSPPDSRSPPPGAAIPEK